MTLSNPVADTSGTQPFVFPQRVLPADLSGNGVNWNQDTTLITATGVTTTQTSADQTNINARGVVVVLDMTTVGTGSVTLSIQGKDVASGKYYTLVTAAAPVTTNSTNVYAVYPGNVGYASGGALAGPLPHIWRVQAVANNANATTYTVGASVLL